MPPFVSTYAVVSNLCGVEVDVPLTSVPQTSVPPYVCTYVYVSPFSVR